MSHQNALGLGGALVVFLTAAVGGHKCCCQLLNYPQHTRHCQFTISVFGHSEIQNRNSDSPFSFPAFQRVLAMANEASAVDGAMPKQNNVQSWWLISVFVCY